MPMPPNPNRASRIEVPGMNANLELVRRQSGTRSASGAAIALIKWIVAHPDALAEFTRWCDEQRDREPQPVK